MPDTNIPKDVASSLTGIFTNINLDRISEIAVAIILCLIGFIIARFVSNGFPPQGRGEGMQVGQPLGQLAYYAILAFVVMIALDQMGVGGSIVREAFLLILGGVVLALALAFGLGGKDWAAAQLERWWPSSDPRDRLP